MKESPKQNYSGIDRVAQVSSPVRSQKLNNLKPARKNLSRLFHQQYKGI